MFDRGSEGHAAILERGRISFLSTDGEASRENCVMLRIRVWIAAVWLAFDTASVVAQAPSTGEVHGVVKLKDTGAPVGELSPRNGLNKTLIRAGASDSGTLK
jgi:hypothetical protein